ncbi:MAG TPA: cation:proton antiporter [Gammaproteobacteria bacterium]|jgi:Kef-type K+ transport system membrane component KefB|nr:cation:proton antiporter [Gammaproteobacteria bacterium]HIF87055.1 cation:proton antiporter [Gammaproteobacteria bacterium]HIL64197.1 cation:proton antiporter [Porticoccaceae bacterium]HIN89632.1 cation:proton antiporter [Porticoccaceae bacterium]|tara:strand:+ start:8172 stop:9332 length:1161 start_codon:yes stop_codon:yes gene_type:complete
MEPDSLLFSFFLIFSGAALASTLALFFRQPLLVAYIFIGGLLGPFGVGYISNSSLLTDIAEFGIIFLLFLLGLDMQPSKLFHTLKKTFLVTLASSIIFILLGYSTGLLFSFSHVESLVIGFAMIFSSTIIGIKLLPTTVLHQKHMGELMVGILLLQDFIAIFLLVFLDSGNIEQSSALRVLLAFPLLLAIAYFATRFILIKLVARFDQFKEYIFLLAIGWCLGLAALASAMGLSAEIGAFIAGVSLATSPISLFIALNLKPLRDFFLILFFFSLGAQFNTALLGQVIAPALLLAALALSVKPVVFHFLLRRFSERSILAWDAGLRLGQISEFSLLIAFVATQSGMIGETASLVIQAAAIMTFLVSSYIVVMFCPTPIASNPKLRRD